MNRTDEQIDAIVLARDIMLARARYYNEERPKLGHGSSALIAGMAGAYEHAADILTAALNEDWELLRNYEGA